MSEDDSNKILAEVLRRIDAGEQVDIESICSAHPEIADELRSYAEGDELLAEMAGDDATGDTSQPGVRDETVRPRGQAGPSIDISGQKFGRYEIKRQLGQGAMGSVYLARDTQLDRDVALKIPKVDMSARAEFLARFKREAQSAAKLNHSNICQVFDFGEVDGQPFITMAYIDGEPLSRFVGRKQVDNQWVADVVRKIADGLAHAHDNGVIHRDLKSANVLVDRSGEPIVTDFGLAGRVNDNDETRITQYGQILGTPAYMSPEQIDGESTLIGPPSDIYALGVILYELLAGELPFRGSFAALVAQVTRDEAKSPRKRNPDADQGLCDLALKMLSKRPSQRPGSMGEVASYLSGLVIGSVKPKPVDKAAKVKLAKLEAGKQRIEELVQRGQFAQAVSILEKMAAVKDADSAEYTQWAEAELARIKSLPQKLKEGTPQLIAAAQKMLARHDYGQAAQILQQIPANMRSPEVAKLLHDAIELEDEADLLITDLKDCVATRTYDGIEDNVKRLLELKPGNRFAKDLWEALQTYQSIPRAQRTYRFDSDGNLQPRDTGLSQGLLAGLTVGVLAFAIMGWFMKGYLANRSENAGRVTVTPTSDPEPAPIPPGNGTGPSGQRNDLQTASAHDRQQLKRLGLALHNYHDIYDRLPPATGKAVRGGMQSGWRFELLPYLQEVATYNLIDASRSLDDPVNQQKLPLLPASYVCEALSDSQRAQGLCGYVAPLAQGTIMSNSDGTRFRDITDGLSDTVLLLLAPSKHAVPWAGFNDLEIDLADPMRDFRMANVEIVTVLMGDGRVRDIPTGIDSEQWRRLLQCNDGQRVDWAQIDQMLETLKAGGTIPTAWTNLFNGRDLTGWTVAAVQGAKPAWTVAGGLLRSPSTASNLVSNDTFEEFELDVVWRGRVDSNGGIFYRVPSGKADDMPDAPAYKLLYGKNGWDAGDITSNGALYGVAGKVVPELAANEFNTSRIVVQNDRIQHWINGNKVVDIVPGSAEWQDGVDRLSTRPLFQNRVSWGDFGSVKPGSIVLNYAYGEPIEFQSIRVRRIESKGSTEQAIDWSPLFNATDFTGWTYYKGGPVALGWERGNGEVRATSAGKSATSGSPYDIVTENTYDNFELEFEWAMPNGGNSGILYRIGDGEESISKSGIEYQFFDDPTHAHWSNPNTRSGAIWPLYGQALPLKPRGQFNTGRIVANGNQIEHWLNGTKVAEATIGSDQWKQDAADQITKRPKFASLAKGRIGIQTYGDELIIRNMRIREILERRDRTAEGRHLSLGFPPNEATRAYVEVPSLSYQGEHPLTIEAWVKLDSNFHVYSGGRETLFSLSESTGFNRGKGLFVAIEPTDTAKTVDWPLAASFKHSNLYTVNAYSSRSFPVEKWTHVAVVLDSQNCTTFVDGKVSGQRQLQPPFEPSDSPLVIGAMRVSDDSAEPKVNNAFTGWMDEIRISRVARYSSSFEPEQNFIADADTMALYHCDEGQGQRLIDSSGNGHHGELRGVRWEPTTDVESPTGPQAASLNNARTSVLSFKNVGDRVEVPELTYNGGTPLTLECWLSPDDIADPDADRSGKLLGFSRRRAGNRASGVHIGVARDSIRTGFFYYFVHRSLVKSPQSMRHIEAYPRHKLATWHHFAAVFDDKLVSLYVDGRLQGKQGLSDPSVFASDFFQVGCMTHEEKSGPKHNYQFYGRIDEIRVSRIARYTNDFTPESEMQPDADTVALYHCDDDDSGVLKDSSGNGLHGTIIGANRIDETP